MSSTPPPLKNIPSAPTPSKSGCKWLIILAAVVTALMLLLMIGGSYIYFKHLRANQENGTRQTAMQNPMQMQPEFAQLLNAINLVLDAPADDLPIGKAADKKVQFYTDSANAKLDSGEYQGLDEFLSSCYADKLMDKDGFFIYRLVLEELVEREGLNKWLNATGSSHAYIALGLHETTLAWLARGNGYSSTVTEKGWEGFRLHLQNATDSYKEAVKKDEHNSVAITLLFKIGLGRGQLQDLIPESIQSAVEHTPEDGMAAVKISYYLTPRWHGSRGQVIAFIRDDLKKWPDSAGKFDCIISRLELATEWGDRQLLSSGPYTQKIYTKIIERYNAKWPEGSFAAARIVRLLIRNKRYMLAANFCRKHEPDFKSKSIYYAHLGRSLTLAKQYPEAKKQLIKAIEAGADDGFTFFYLGQSAAELNDNKLGEEMSLAAVEKLALSERWKRGAAYGEASRCAARRSDFAAALNYAEQAIKVDPKQGRSWYCQGVAKYRLNRKKEAKADFEQAIKLRPSFRKFIKSEFPDWRSY